ncbi:hypothetical protein [Afipia felis]|uniref:Uncharacterized protein n=2 Tax=Afipia felis TaxID=1035 RepID=A0A380W2T4_AFIFE|nr:hypothetical protein [Afipia felis]EKS30359.1 hypothetical protein HMPREF9697_02887 [Afipia felis ATCC 53690]SUU75104.1 Uncharacterised protein [Afipia felis]SUU83170.1 Uncharacterised protein [Afipia felis]
MVCTVAIPSLTCDKLTQMTLMPLPEIQPRKDAGPVRSGPRKGETNAPFMGVFGFSVLGLLLCCILGRLPISRDFLSTKILLIFMAAPVAAWLGFSLGGGE